MQKEVFDRFTEFGLDVDDNTNAMMAYWDKDLICRYANNAYENWFGVRPEQMIGKMTLRQLLGPLFEQNLPFIDAVLAGKVQTFERDIKVPGGEVRNSLETYFPDFQKGKVNGFFVHVADISPIRRRAGILKRTAPFPIVSDNELLDEVVKTLRSFLLSEFPGIPRLALMHNVSTAKLKRLFKEQYQSGVFSYYRHLQMELAEKYLTQQKCSIKQMASLLNFSNPYNFTICFKKYLVQTTDKRLVEKIQKEENQYYKTLVSQMPVAIAMLDSEMRYLAVSEKWKIDFGRGFNILVGMSHRDFMPGIVEIQECSNVLSNGISRSGEGWYDLSPADRRFLRWNISPWRENTGKVAGLLLFFDDITEYKLKEHEGRKIQEIFDKTTEIARIGAWNRDFVTNRGFWSKTAKEILEVPPDFEPFLGSALNFYKPGPSLELALKVLKDALDNGSSFDIEVDMITATGREKRMRVIGYPELHNGKCEKLYGIFLDASVSITKSL